MHDRGDWKFEVSKHDKNSTGGTLSFSRGGFQEARGSCGSGGHDWMIEGVKELLDHPGKNVLFEPFVYKSDHFAKTGSGQT